MMINYMPRESDDQTYELLYGCIKMFSEVDINGDGMMEWSEFVQYIIDAVSANSIKRGEG
jgi:Ca2+-binding EF-hand superfamily protein